MGLAVGEREKEGVTVGVGVKAGVPVPVVPAEAMGSIVASSRSSTQCRICWKLLEITAVEAAAKSMATGAPSAPKPAAPINTAEGGRCIEVVVAFKMSAEGMGCVPFGGALANRG